MDRGLGAHPPGHDLRHFWPARPRGKPYNLAVRTKDNTQNAQEEAAKYLKKPYERKKSPEAEQ
jgi:hypothetical protein